jgi:polyisoprenyl-phosphate glycosyltransferase
LADDEQRPIVITGASGFVGANLLRYFALRGHRVIGVEGPGGADWRTRSAGVELVRVDLCQESDVRAFVRDAQPLAILNCAAYGAYPSQTETARIYRVNLDAVRTLLEAAVDCPGFRAFIQAGSSSEYGLHCSGPGELSATWPDSHYAVSKVAASGLVQFFAAKHRVPAWGLRLYSVYGPFEDFSRLIPKLLLHARRGELPPLVNPSVSRDFVFVDDVSAAFRSIVTQATQLKPGQIYNIGVGQRVTLEDLVSVTSRVFALDVTPTWGSMPNRNWDHSDWFSNPERARRELNWVAATPLEQGLLATMRWLDAYPDLVEEGQRSSVTSPQSGIRQLAPATTPALPATAEANAERVA